MKQLAIVIPAYKINFFERAVKSLANQTCKDFVVYVGNDHSTEEFEFICEKYKSQIEIVYHRFDSNLGSVDLVAQWERCIALTNNEPWIWLFSDDDEMGARCVELFLNARELGYDIYHFDVKTIDENSVEIGKGSKYPSVITSFQLYRGKMINGLMSLVVENVFSRDVYESCNKFQKFDLAWGSDTATWVKFAQKKGMKTIHGDYVYWRESSLNISPTLTAEVVERKTDALNHFFSWSVSFFQSSYKYRLRIVNTLAYLKRMRIFVKFIDTHIVNRNLEVFLATHGLSRCLPVFRLVLNWIK